MEGGIALKKLLCALLAAVLTLTLMIPCTATDFAGFSDQQEIENNNAVRMLYDLGLISGYSDGSFGPQNPIRREEVAKLMALLCKAEPQAQNASVPFYDSTTSWAADYIAYCAEHDIIAGSSGRFRPADHVTIRELAKMLCDYVKKMGYTHVELMPVMELAKMLLVILGEDASRYVGASWAQNVDEDAFVKGIYAGVSANYDSAATRDTACLLIYNAMLCPKVADASLEGDQRYVLDGLMNPMSYLEIRFGLTRYTATLTGNECADLTSAGNTLSAGTSKLAGHKAFDISTDLSLLGRNVDIYVKDGTVFGIPCYAVDEVYYTFTDASQLKEICAGGGFRLTEETAYYYNYTPSNKDILNTLSENDKITVIDHDGDNAFDVVLVTTSYPATVTSVSPLTVDVDGETQTVRAFSSTDVFTVGEAVYYSQICGNGYIRRLS